MPMQPFADPPRDHLTAAEVATLVQDTAAPHLGGGLELVDLSLNILEDISDDFGGGRVERQSYAVMHGSATFRVSRQLDWGAGLVRPYITFTVGTVSAKFYLGVYHVSTPAQSLAESPATYDVEGYDILLRLNQPVGDSYSIAAGEAYLAKVEEILLARGYQVYIIDQAAAAVVAPTARVWLFDQSITWLTVVNDLLGSIGYAGVWSDWNGALRIDPYQLPLDRSVEWVYTDDPETTMLSNRRTIERDYSGSPNQWVVYRNNNVDDVPPVEGNGVYTYTNDHLGDTSVQARGGMVIPKVVGVDAADHASLVVRAMEIIQADMDVPTIINVETAPNPLHWHFDRLMIQDSASLPIADIQCTQWALPIPPETGDQPQTWRVISS